MKNIHQLRRSSASQLKYTSRIQEFGSAVEAVPRYFVKHRRPSPSDAGLWNASPTMLLSQLRRRDRDRDRTTGNRAVESRPLDHVAGYTVDDFGVHDFCHADRRSVLRVKGQNGFCPVGPVIVGTDQIEPRMVELRTLVNNDVVLLGKTSELVFPFAYLSSQIRAELMLPEEGGRTVRTLGRAGPACHLDSSSPAAAESSRSMRNHHVETKRFGGRSREQLAH